MAGQASANQTLNSQLGGGSQLVLVGEGGIVDDREEVKALLAESLLYRGSNFVCSVPIERSDLESAVSCQLESTSMLSRRATKGPYRHGAVPSTYTIQELSRVQQLRCAKVGFDDVLQR